MCCQVAVRGRQAAKALYFVAIVVCAPVWEELIFRGFLLPSLANYMPLGAAVAASAALFGAVHFSLQHFLPLCLLGAVLGTLLVRTRSLAACVALHALWNGWVFWQLACRAAGA